MAEGFSNGLYKCPGLDLLLSMSRCRYFEPLCLLREPISFLWLMLRIPLDYLRGWIWVWFSTFRCIVGLVKSKLFQLLLHWHLPLRQPSWSKGLLFAQTCQHFPLWTTLQPGNWLELSPWWLFVARRLHLDCIIWWTIEASYWIDPSCERFCKGALV